MLPESSVQPSDWRVKQKEVVTCSSVFTSAITAYISHNLNPGDGSDTGRLVVRWLVDRRALAPSVGC
eukprot:5564124-Pyramimonas_sp.AAC.1